jgi:hypothetical protein
MQLFWISLKSRYVTNLSQTNGIFTPEKKYSNDRLVQVLDRKIQLTASQSVLNTNIIRNMWQPNVRKFKTNLKPMSDIFQTNRRIIFSINRQPRPKQTIINQFSDQSRVIPWLITDKQIHEKSTRVLTMYSTGQT